MSEIAISVSGLSKRYQIGVEQQSSYPTLRDKLNHTALAPLRAARHLLNRNGNGHAGNGHATDWKGKTIEGPKGNSVSTRRVAQDRTIWALKDVSFDVKRGEVLGIIGRNGAGKSTLLKILSRITEPTEGYADITGRLSSLLEVGTGFHPELTGRENIFLNGSILGMRRTEIQRKFDEIVSFAEVERFIDTPVKYYSSGMYVRLAFAVAAHLEPEILLVDEVLAVGDIDFQKKCVGSMQSVAASGRTVLVVSHNVGLIESLCTRAMLIEDGRVASLGKPPAVIADYIGNRQLSDSENLNTRPRTCARSSAWFSSIHLLDKANQICRDFRAGEKLTLKLGIEIESPIRQPWIGIRLRTSRDQLISHIANRESGYELPSITGASEIRCQIGSLNLLPGRYIVDLVLADMLNRRYDEVAGAAYFDVHETDIWKSGMPLTQAYGLVFFPSEWELTKR